MIHFLSIYKYYVPNHFLQTKTNGPEDACTLKERELVTTNHPA